MEGVGTTEILIGLLATVVIGVVSFAISALWINDQKLLGRIIDLIQRVARVETKQDKD